MTASKQKSVKGKITHTPDEEQSKNTPGLTDPLSSFREEFKDLLMNDEESAAFHKRIGTNFSPGNKEVTFVKKAPQPPEK